MKGFLKGLAAMAIGLPCALAIGILGGWLIGICILILPVIWLCGAIDQFRLRLGSTPR